MSEENILKQKVNAFIGALDNLLKRMENGDSDARATLAKLKRGIGKKPGTCIEMFPFVIPKIDGIQNEKTQNAFFMVASLFAIHQIPEKIDNEENEQKSWSNFGDTFRKVAIKSDSESIEKRFVALLNSHYDELFKHLRHAVSLAKSKEISINYTNLLWDIIKWDSEDQKVQKKWAKSFWGLEIKYKENDIDQDQDNNSNEEEYENNSNENEMEE